MAKYSSIYFNIYRFMYLFEIGIVMTLFVQFGNVISINSNYSINERLQNKAKFPPSIDGKPVQVRAGMYLESIGKFQAAEMSFDVDLYMYLSWKDSNLNHSNTEYILVNDPEVRKLIWLPDLYFANARTSKFHDVTVANFNLFIAQDGTIAYSIRITLNVACNLDLHNYPLDKQMCGIRLVSYAHVEKRMNISWFDDNPVRYNQEIALPEFDIVNMNPAFCNGSYRYAIMIDGRYNYEKFSCLEAKIYLNRQIGYHLLQSYAPSGLIVIISWVSFWIDRRAVPGRVTLSFTTLLTLSTLGNGMRVGLPQVAYAKAIDIWFGACMLFVFMSLLEFAMVNSYTRQADKYKKLASAAMPKKSAVCIESNESESDCSQLEEKNDNNPTSVEKKKSVVLHFHGPSLHKMREEPCYSDDLEKPVKCEKGHDIAESSLKTSRSSSKTCLNDAYDSENKAQIHGLTKRIGRVNQNENGNSFGNNDESKNVLSKVVRKASRIHNSINSVNRDIRKSFHISQRAQNIDKWSRFIFPIFFMVFNLYYWTYYLWYNGI